LAICFGLHAWPTGDPDADRGVGRSTSGPRIEGPSGAVNAPDSRSCTYSRSRSLAASLLTFGRHVCRFSLPLRDDGPIVQRAAAGRRVAAQLPGSPSVRRSRSAALRVRHPSDRPPSVGRVAVPISVLLHILGQQNGVQWEWNGESLLAYREAGVRVGWADNAAPCADQMPCRHDTCRNQEDVTHEAECHPGAGPRPDLPALPPRSRRPQGPSWKRGRLSRESEEGLERYLGLSQRRVVSTNSCTEALHIARHLRAKGAGRRAAVGPDRVPRRSGA
jgi:hypothetical protein